MVTRGEPWRRPEGERELEEEMELIRSGSATPTVEGSAGALHGADVFLDDELRANPAYHSYYYSSVNNNPRLPPPLLSREDWRSAQRLRPGGPGSCLGGIGDGRRPTGSGAGTGRPGDGLIGMPGLEIGRQSSFSGFFQDDSYQHDTNRQGANRNSTDLLGSSRNRYGLHHESGAMQVLAQHVENQDRTMRALRYELYTSRAHLWDALVQLIPLVRSGHLPPDVLYPARTQMPSHVAWPEVGGYTPPRGPLLPLPHKELPGYYGGF